MSLSDLYQEIILDHNKRPRNYGPLEGARESHGHNPLCGDRLTLYVKLDGDRIDAIRFEGSGCAISKASASLMTDAVKGKSLADAESLFATFQAMITRPMDQPTDEADEDALGKLAALGGVRAFPVRIKCASLAWHTLRAALRNDAHTAKTE